MIKLNTLIIVVLSFVVSLAGIANCYPEGSIVSDTSSAVVHEDDVKKVENRTEGKYDWTEKWEPPGRLKSWFPYYIIGKDDEGAKSKRELH